MNQKSIFNLFSPKGKAQAGVQRGVSTLIISAVALSLVVFTAYVQIIPVSEPVAIVAAPQAETSGQHRIETLSNIDQADQKFFSPVQKDLWNRAGSGFELTNAPDADEVKAPVEKDVWNHAGSGFELSSVQPALAVPLKTNVWNWAGSGFELSSVRTPAEIKASIEKYMWNRADRQAAARSFHQWRTSQVVAAFNSAGLELEIVRTGKKGEDDGLSMFMAVEATCFRIPSAGETEGGIILSFYKADDLARMQNYYLALNKSLPQFSSWVFVKDNILLQINRSLPGPKARQYAAALDAMKTDKPLMITAQASAGVTHARFIP